MQRQLEQNAEDERYVAKKRSRHHTVDVKTIGSECKMHIAYTLYMK